MDEKTQSDPLETMPLDELCVNTIRTLAMDAVQKANSGHPGTPMALAPAAYVLWARFLRHNPADARWFDRDRFVLSAGHASMLLYAMLHLTGYDLPLDELKNFRQWGSRTAGHPEYGLAPGVEVTTGPLGQGIMHAVGMAMAEAHLAARFNRDGYSVVDHFTYVFCSDGDLMEGASHEAAAMAGHLGLGKLVCLYDENHISIDGDTSITLSDDVKRRFEGYHWHVQHLGERANDLDALTGAFAEARQMRDRPSLIVVRSHIAFGAPNKQDTAEAHGAPLGEDEVRATKKFYGWPEDASFLVPDRVRDHMGAAVENGKRAQQEWRDMLDAYRKVHAEDAAAFEAAMAGTLPEGWDEGVPAPEAGKSIATRATGGEVLNAIAANVPWLMGGAADLASSTKAIINTEADFGKGCYEGRNVRWGVREHVMCAASSGMALHGGIRPFASTFFIFTDYARPAIRLAALMELPVVYVLSHDSIGLGEDGPTHQPIEHLASFRAMPHMCVLRPADASETLEAFRVALTRVRGPTMIILTRHKVPVIDRSVTAPAEQLEKGAYVLSWEQGDRPDVILMASGSEVHLILEAQGRLREQGIDARIVSMPSWELFRAQDRSRREEVLPPSVRARLAVEAGSPTGWCEWTGDSGRVLGISTFGASAPGDELFRQYGFTVENIVAQVRRLLDR